MADPLRLVDDYALYIGGQWVEPRSGRYDDISPSTEQTIAAAPDADFDDVDAAIGAARTAFDEGPWSAATSEERARCLAQLGNALLEHADDFFALAQVEWGCIANERLIQIDGPPSWHSTQENSPRSWPTNRSTRTERQAPRCCATSLSALCLC